MPSVSSSSRPKVLLSSTVMTPSLPTLSMASAMISPTVESPAEMEAVEAICSLVSTSLASCERASETLATAASMPRLRAIGFAPAATLRRPSRTSAWARTVAVVVPSPATSSVFLATSLTSSAPIFSKESSSSISLAIDTPSLVMVGAPHFFSSTTLRPLGPSVTLTASASWFMPRSRPRRASSSNAINLAIGCGPHFSYGHAVGIGAEIGPAAAPATDGPLAPRVGRVGLTAYRLALTLDECQFRFSTHPRRVQEIRAGRTGRTARIDRFGGRVKDRSGPGPESGAAARARELSGVDDLDAVGLGTLRTLDDLELHPLVLVEGPIALGLDRRVVDEHVLAVVHGDEAVALLVVEPLHGALCHVHSLLCSQWGLFRCLTPRGARGLRSSAPLHCRARSCCGISGPWYLACRNSSLDRGGRYTERPAFSRRGFRPAKGPSALAVQ